MEQNNQQPPVQPVETAAGERQNPAPAPQQPEKKKDEEFSLAWHLKTLAVIYAVLGVFYIILRLTLK